jgi:hypothetical protein
MSSLANSESISPQEWARVYAEIPDMNPRALKGVCMDTPGMLRLEEYQTIEGLMLFGSPHDGESFTFEAQMKAIKKSGIPQTFFLTANSAIPVADTIRGYCDELDLPHPNIFPIAANKRSVLQAGNIEDYDGRIHPCLTQEIERLIQTLRESPTEDACLLDQLVCSGETMRVATWMLIPEVSIKIR